MCKTSPAARGPGRCHRSCSRASGVGGSCRLVRRTATACTGPIDAGASTTSTFCSFACSRISTASSGRNGPTERRASYAADLRATARNTGPSGARRRKAPSPSVTTSVPEAAPTTATSTPGHGAPSRSSTRPVIWRGEPTCTVTSPAAPTSSTRGSNARSSLSIPQAPTGNLHTDRAPQTASKRWTSGCSTPGAMLFSLRRTTGNGPGSRPRATKCMRSSPSGRINRRSIPPSAGSQIATSP
jgi:hypothetical protein